jgi:hypothetical protein
MLTISNIEIKFYLLRSISHDASLNITLSLYL